MNQLILFLLLLGIIFVTTGFLELYFDSKQTKIEKEYRIVPRDVYDQIEVNNILLLVGQLKVKSILTLLVVHGLRSIPKLLKIIQES